MKYSIEELCTKKEDQVFDRKSARKDAKGLSNHIVAFANADGGTLVIGIEDNGDITGIDAYTNNINDILRVPFDYCTPSVMVTTETVECRDKDGNPNHLLIMTIPQSSELHANQQDEVYYRMGDKLNISPQTGQQNGGNRSRVTVEMSPGVRLRVQAVE